jgi:CRP-like cAMP-binding protein
VDLNKYLLLTCVLQHETNSNQELEELGSYTKLVQLEPGEILYEDQDFDRGLFFIEEGVMVRLQPVV